MPRQLPWVNKGRGGRTQVRATSKHGLRASVQSDIDDDFFEGTVLGTSQKDTGRGVVRDSDDEIPEIPKYNARASHKGKEPVERSRLLSSSPPPAEEILPPTVEYMDKGVDKFDLRDDEWMMVEDEFLQTAKLFTRHLHLAEYERLKAKIEEQKKETTVRPVVANAKPSIQGYFKKKASDQTKAQTKAMKDGFIAARSGADSNTRSKQNSFKTTSASSARRAEPATTSMLQKHLPSNHCPTAISSGSDSDDLDAPERPRTHTAPTELANAASTARSTFPATPLFAKPALPSTSRVRQRIDRPTPFDMWDDFEPNRSASPSKAAGATSKPIGLFTAISVRSSKTQRSQEPAQVSPTRGPEQSPSSAAYSAQRPKKPGRSFDFLEDLESPKRDSVSSFTKRKAGKEKEEKRKSAKVEDTIPTFLF